MILTIRNSLLALSALAGLAANSLAQYLPSPLGIPVAPHRYFYGQVNVNNLGQNYSLGYILTTPHGNRYTYLPSVGYNPVYASQSKAIRDARKQEFLTEVPTRRELTAKVNEPRIDRNPNELFDGLPTAFKSAVVTTTPADIVNGKALNEILIATIDLEKRGAKANGSFLSPEITAHIRFAGTANADLANWVRAGEIDFPAAFRTDDYSIPRAWLKHDFGVVVANLTSGKTPDSSLYQALVTAGRTIRRTFDERKSQLAAIDQKVGEQFLSRYDAMANIVRTPATVDLCTNDWATLGVSVVEMVDHLAKYRLQFGTAPSGQDAAYEALHRALSGYTVSLIESRK